MTSFQKESFHALSFLPHHDVRLHHINGTHIPNDDLEANRLITSYHRTRLTGVAFARGVARHGSHDTDGSLV